MLTRIPLAGHFYTAGERNHIQSESIICVLKFHTTQGFYDNYNAHRRVGFYCCISDERHDCLFSFVPVDATFIQANTEPADTGEKSDTELRNESHRKTRCNITVNSCVSKNCLLAVLKI